MNFECYTLISQRFKCKTAVRFWCCALTSFPDTGVLCGTMEDGSRSAQPDTPPITNTATLFDGLPLDALSVIVTQTNHLIDRMGYALPLNLAHLGADDPWRYKRSMHWSLRFLALLFSENSPFRAAAAMFVSRIQVNCANPEAFIESTTKMLSIGPEIFEDYAKEIELGRIVLSACGPYVRRISVVNVPKNEVKASHLMENFMAHVFQYCRNVQEITFRGYQAPLTKWGLHPRSSASTLQTCV